MICCELLWIPDEAKHNMLKQLGHLWKMPTHHSPLKGGENNSVLIVFASQRKKKYILNDLVHYIDSLFI